MNPCDPFDLWVAGLSPLERAELEQAIRIGHQVITSEQGARIRARDGLAPAQTTGVVERIRQALTRRPVARFGNEPGRIVDYVTTVIEGSRAIGVPARTVTQWVASGRVTGRRSGATWLIDTLDLEQKAADRE